MKKVLSNIKLKHQDGFSPIEVLLAVTVFGMFVVALVGVMVFGQSSVASAGYNERATFLAQEALDAVGNIRDENINNISDGTYGLVQSGGVWTLAETPDITDVYARSVTISSIDAYRKNINAHVTWSYREGQKSVDLQRLLTGWGSVGKTWLNAIKAGSYNISGTNNALKVATSGNYAYVVRGSGSPNFAAIDISDSATPALVGELSSLASSPTDIFVNGNYAFVTTSSNSAELQIIDVSNPAAPTIAGTYNAPGNANGLAVFVEGSYAYLARASNGNSQEFSILDISNPASPLLLGSYSDNISMRDVVVGGNYAYIGTSSVSQEVLVMDVNNPVSPNLVATINIDGNKSVSALAKSGNVLFVARSSSLAALDVSDPLAPVVVSEISSDGGVNINDLSVDTTGNNYIFMGTDFATGEFQIIDMSDLANMTVVKTVDADGDINGVSYDAALDVVAGVGVSNNEELTVFVKN
ncbi:MAG: hypothetical protein PVI21_01105 [Candidatus Woesebacteria bacterium]|jgi:Tfp pilus assembly protein PilV